MNHLQRTTQEFTRQAKQFSSSAAITAADLTARFVDAVDAGPDTTILDVACGPGIVTAARAGVANVTFEQGSATALPFPDDHFDGVVTRLSVHHFDTPRLVLAEMFRVLKPGGRFVLADVVSSEDAAESELHNAIEVLRDPSHVRMLPATELTSMITEAGFTIDTQSTWDQPRKFDEWAAIVDDPQRIAPLRTIVRRLAGAGEHAGFGLSLVDGAVVFFHRWRLFSGGKPQ
jgi:ubiquinone/menaquinone biosynthesis C-methylase UbiE